MEELLTGIGFDSIPEKLGLTWSVSNSPSKFVGYLVLLAIMLLSAMLTLFRLDWQPGAALLVSAGAAAFMLSDVILALNKFVSPITNGRVINIAIYHLAQILLVAGVIQQFG